MFEFCWSGRDAALYSCAWTLRPESLELSPFSSIAIIKHLTHYQPLNGNLLPLALPCHVPTLHSCTHIPLPSVPALLPASPEGLSKLFALSQLLFIGFDTKDKCSYGIPYLGKCHASYIQLSTTMPSALCYLQKADFRGK